uniref:Imidazole glycerol phosphate synthase subunit HisH n=1 Tax=Candidatus Blochmannia nearcticus (nom. nud.) TaxID=251545 RepID=D2XN22_9ENTR|nr:imidazole glycerol phosphate synthase HisH subunit [Candidatus Blochmannia nearcticus]
MNIVIINTKCSNLFSVKTMLHKLGYKPVISDNIDIISQADKLFLPGVGSALSAMKQLKKKNLVDLIQNCTKPILGICLGMQLLGTISEENNGVKTLQIIKVPVIRMQYRGFPIPHMGWNTITIPQKHCLFYGIKKNNYFYFAHSYIIKVCHVTISQTNYGQLFSSIIEYKNFFGVQFHPEKSGIPGQQLVKNFLEM